MSAIRNSVGEETFIRLEAVAETEVALAMQMPLLDKWGKEKYYQRRALLTELLSLFQEFEEKDLKIAPLDIVTICFKAKLLKACQTDHEFAQRAGGSDLFAERAFVFSWSEKSEKIEDIIEKHLLALEGSIIKRALVVEISDLRDFETEKTRSEFFDGFFGKFDPSYRAYVDFDQEKRHAKFNKTFTDLYPGAGADSIRHCPLAFSYETEGSWTYVYFVGTARLRAFLNVLRVAAFLYPAQVDFGTGKVQIMAPSSPYMLRPEAMGGGYSWEEDEKKPWEKIPDGVLFLSFGYRGIVPMFLDGRNLGGVEKVFNESKVIFEHLKNPWTSPCISDIAPTLDILSSATQIPDLGAKILQIYCCLEHLFVPKGITKDMTKYIIGAINVLKPELKPWFDDLYKLRNNYAHRGYVQRTETTRSMTSTSVHNVLTLLVAKLNQSKPSM
ncbi:MAG: hypothetical protein JWN64_843 [Parcubacteria group bacterium]|nr:hypothetical protein [Parcubacteria group bacterium]